MTVYFVCFFVAFILSLYAEYNKKNIKKITYQILIFLAIFIPSIVAGLRLKGVGTDTLGYIDHVFKNMINITSVSDFFKYVSNSSVEFMFCFIDYILTRFFDSVNVSYFVFQFINLLFIYWACDNFNDSWKKSLSYYIYLILFFNRSLNMCRQSIAIAICLFSIKYIFNRNFLKFLLLIIFASLFHKTSIIFLPMFYLYKLITGKNKNFFKILFLLILSFITIMYVPLIKYLINVGIIPLKYMRYISGNTYNISEIDSFIKIIISIICLFFYKMIIKKNKQFNLFTYMMLMGNIIMFTGFYSNYGQRLAYYFEYSIIFCLPEIVSCFKGKYGKLTIASVLIIVLLIYSYLAYSIYGWDNTVPYLTILKNHEVKI